jgi:hypothetical protein
MKTSETQALPASPNLLVALRTGFDSITNHIALLAFPILLDLLLWLGPRLQVKGLIQAFTAQLMAFTGTSGAQTTEMVQLGRELWDLMAEHFNLFAALRSYPVGIPSLMAGRLPMEAPGWVPYGLDVQSLAGVVLLWLGLTLLGLVSGSYYFSAVAQAALLGEVQWGRSLAQWPWVAGQVVALALFWLALFLVVAFPGSVLISILTLMGLSVGQCAILVYAGILVWLAFPLLFSPHGIFVYQLSMIGSVKASVRLTRLTFPTTGLFLLVSFFLSKGLDVLWSAPKENSWLTLIGVAGHAFITTGLLAASFVYYRDADRWVQGMLRRVKFSSIQRV